MEKIELEINEYQALLASIPPESRITNKELADKGIVSLIVDCKTYVLK